jgi:hypothetical protein
VLSRAEEIPIPQTEIQDWAMWARQQADRIGPVKNGSIDFSVSGQTEAAADGTLEIDNDL